MPQIRALGPARVVDATSALARHLGLGERRARGYVEQIVRQEREIRERRRRGLCLYCGGGLIRDWDEDARVWVGKCLTCGREARERRRG